MASLALSSIKEYMLRQVGAFDSFTTNGTGGAAGIWLVCSTLEYGDDALRRSWVETTSGSTKEVRKIKHNYFPSGKIEPWVDFTAQIATAVTCEIHRFNPALATFYINEAVKRMYPEFCIPVVDDTVITGNLAINGNFEYWAATTNPYLWTLATATATEETTTVLFGDSSMKMGTAAGTCYLSSNDYPSLLSLENSILAADTFQCHVNTAAASNARIFIYTITQAGTAATTNSDNHTGGGKWEKLSVDSAVTIPDDLAEIRFGVQTQTTDDAYFDNAYIKGTNYEYLLPPDVTDVITVFQAEDWDEHQPVRGNPIKATLVNKSGVEYLHIPNYLAGKKIQICGRGKFAALSARTDTLNPISPTWETLIKKAALVELLRAQANSLSSMTAAEARTTADKLDQEVNYERYLNAVDVEAYHIPNRGVVESWSE